MKRLLTLTVLFVVLTACASAPVRQQTYVSVKALDQALNTLQDTERATCNAPLAASGQDINACTPDAVKIGMTIERHRQFSAQLVQLLEAKAVLVASLQTWQAGQPEPAAVRTLETTIAQAMALARTLLPAASQPLVAAVQGAINEITKIRQQLSGGLVYEA